MVGSIATRDRLDRGNGPTRRRAVEPISYCLLLDVTPFLGGWELLRDEKFILRQTEPGLKFMTTSSRVSPILAITRASSVSMRNTLMHLVALGLGVSGLIRPPGEEM